MEVEKARVTELHVRMDCNGCVHKIKKALHNIDGVYDVYVDFAQQKLTVIGRADPENIVKAIKKTKKIATICSHTEPEPAEQAAAAPEQPPAEVPEQPPSEAPPAPPEEPPKDPPTEADVNPTPEAKPSSEPNVVEEIHMVHNYPSSNLYKEHWHHYPDHYPQHYPASAYYVTQSYNNYRPSPYVSEYQDVRYNEGGSYSHDGYHRNQGNGDGSQITSMFSDENPNACRIV
ncbi:uncharacterized protein [Typha latifolia]|uniref:uncharacterized protein n=1 Tax=Typha latifolia TaxID=4733 RepID=UPI003C30C914